jgi:hypothetical protein
VVDQMVRGPEQLRRVIRELDLAGTTLESVV